MHISYTMFKLDQKLYNLLSLFKKRNILIVVLEAGVYEINNTYIYIYLYAYLDVRIIITTMDHNERVCDNFFLWKGDSTIPGGMK